MNVVIARMSHETNTFSTVKTRLEDYSPSYGDKIFDVYSGTRTELGGFIDVLQREDIGIVPTIAVSATPSGPLLKRDYEIIVEDILAGVKGLGKVDGVLLSLHGAMVAEGYPEAEGNLLQRLRNLVGRKTPIICTLDLHALVSEQMVGNIDAIFGYDTNPHIDAYERGIEAAEVMVKTLRGDMQPITAFKKLRMMPPTINQRTTEGPMVKLFERARKMETMDKVINVSVFGGFPYADVPRIGSSVVSVTDGDLDLARSLSEDLGEIMWEVRREFLKALTPVGDAVERAIEAESGPIILADVADNPGGGAPGDGTVILRELMRSGAKNVGVGVIKDPEAVNKAIQVGVKGTVTMKIGGKTDGFHGEPVEVTGSVKTITDGIFVHKAGRIGLKADVGRTAVLDVGGIDIILTEKSHAPNDPEVFRRNGIEPTEKKILLLKSRGHFRAAYEPFSKEIIEVDAPGLTTPNLNWFRYQSVPRPIWPLDDI